MFTKGEIIIFMDWEYKTFLAPITYTSTLHTGGKLLDSLNCWLFYNNNNNNLKIFPAVKGCNFSFMDHYVCKTNW